MSKMKWSRPVGQIKPIHNIVTLSIVLAISLSLRIITDGEFFGPPFFPLLLLVTVAAMYYEYRGWRDVWHSIRTRIERPTHLVLPDIFEALDDGGIPFALGIADPGVWVKSYNPGCDQVIELDHGELRLHLHAGVGYTLLYLGPIKKGNEDEVGRVKGLVERVAGEA